ncbi:right-handed parallel beta-helix repeat-containing protein [Catenovulum sediminis]|uniref:right-handed parallel beta-helix repeat-containing protein n=1 Tax=Catenovulum sediminis TaxID=1740262 RepID=UPI00117CCBA9|nr:right-handed parallel beta-helix repeat-containing protein [Catenovulum sediminis]
MFNNRFCLAVAATSLLFSLNVSAKTVYVAPDGSDQNNGTENAPWATFAKANANLQAGDTLIVEGGEYRQTMRITQSGTDTNPIVIRPADGEKVVIVGTNPINDWVAQGDGIYATSVNMSIAEHSRQIYQNQELMQIARWPNDSDNDVFTIDAHQVNTAGTESRLYVDGIPDVDLTEGYLWYLGQHSGTSWTKKITSNTLSEINFTPIDITKWPYSNHNPVHKIDGGYGRFYVYGKLDLLDNEREWFYDSTTQTLYFKPADGQLPAPGSVEYAARERAVQINGSYVDMEGINVRGANVRLDGHFNRYAGAEVMHGKQRFDNHTSTSGSGVFDGSIMIVGRDNIVENNVIKFGSINGIHVAGWSGAGTNTVIQGNEIRYFDTLGIHSSPIRSNAANVKILKNTISHTGRDGIYVIGQGSEVAYNDISYAAMINNDGGLFYTVGNTEYRNIEIHHNWFHDAMQRDYHDKRTAGIYLDNDSKGFLVHHNVVWNVPWSGIQLNWDNWDNHIYHNTLVDVGQAMGEWINGRNPRDNRVWNNYSSHADWLRSDAYDLDSNIISAINQFVDSANQNFMPNATSSLLDSGKIIDDLSKPYAGPAPDVGAYEAGGIQWTAGVNAIEDICNSCASDPNANPVHPPIAASLAFDDRAKYLSNAYLAGGALDVSVNFDAGTGNTISDAFRGVKFYLRLIDKSSGKWVSLNDTIVFDSTVIGQRAGTASASLPLTDLVPTAELQPDQFYFVFVQFKTSAGVVKSLGVQPINVIEPTPALIEWDDVNKYRNTPFLNNDFLDITLNIDAGSSQTITSDFDGVEILLRELRSNWSVVKDYSAHDASVVGNQTANPTVSVPLFGVTPSSELPAGNFYYLYARFKSSDGKTYTVSASPVIIDSDFDNDGIGDMTDTDDDNDNVPDSMDDFPHDAVYGVLGDFDGDNDVDRKDVSFFVRALRNPALHRPEFDFNGDGKVHQSDVSKLRNLCTRARCAE